MEVQISLQSPDFVFFKYIPRSGIAGSYGGCCYFLNIFEAHSHCDYPNLQSCQECQCPLSPSSSPTPTFCLFGNSHSKQVGGEISLWFWFAFSWLLAMLIIFYVSVFFEKCLFSFSDHFFFIMCSVPPSISPGSWLINLNPSPWPGKPCPLPHTPGTAPSPTRRFLRTLHSQPGYDSQAGQHLGNAVSQPHLYSWVRILTILSISFGWSMLLKV